MRLKLVLAGIVFSTAVTAFPQAAPSALQSGIPLTVGFGYSNFYTDWSAYEGGLTLWLDWDLNQMPRRLHGLGLEAEARDLNFERTGDVPKLREYTLGGGPIYHYRRFNKVDPYGKFIMSIGHIEFNNRPGDYYTHDSRTVYAPGGGAAYRVWRNVAVRGEYEYQIWPDFLRHHAFNPKGFSFGVTYDLGHIHSR
jgi:opacity protein-like surface antigen